MLAGLLAAGFTEVVVADGGSNDDTRELARRAGGTVVAAPRGRGSQMNTGARACVSPLLLFLHADSLPPPGAPALIRAALARREVAGGAFRLRFDGGGRWTGVYAAFTRLETGLTTFGDAGLFVRREVFEAVGGFPDTPFLEDVELRRRLKRAGRFVKLPAAVVTSARRFGAEGPVRRMALNGLVLLLHRLGTPPARLGRLYRDRG